MCDDKPYRRDCRSPYCPKSNAYIVPSDRTPRQIEQAKRAQEEKAREDEAQG